jgi:potassium-transporting ATPase KdpC subunit
MSTATRAAITTHEDTIIDSAAHGHHPPAPVKHSIWMTAIRFTILTTIVLGIAYPVFITGVAQLLFPHQANGSLILKNGQVIGSELIGQTFTSDKYFHPRPSAAGNGYDATASGGTNLAQSNGKLATRIQADIDRLQQANGGKPVPIDMVTTSASGLDPDITPDNADYQAPRIAATRNLSEDAVRKLIAAHTKGRDLAVFGEPRINVLELNLALDAASPVPTSK